MYATMETRLRSTSLGRSREQSIDTEDGRQSMDDFDIDVGIETGGIETGGKSLAHLVAILKDEDVCPPAPLPPAGMTTRRKSATRAIPVPQAAQGQGAQASLPSSQDSTGSGFISGIMNQQTALSHTPPTNLVSSYELQHFGKRPRSGSVSGRLRSASVLEDKGLIDGNQKAVLKDLIISGDEELQAALDKYEQGDTATLEHMIRSGELMNRAAADIDLLGDLDLDFLNVDDHFGDIGPPMDQHHPSTFPLQPPPTFPSKDFSYNTADSHPTIVSLHDEEVIGDIPGEFSNEEFLKQAQLSAHDTRFRSNSLAYGPLLNDQHAAVDNTDQYGGWMDRHIAETRDGRVGSIGGLSYPSSDAPSGIGGIAESLAQYAKSKGEANPMTKAQLAEAKRREKAEKKEQRDREKAEKKEQRDRAKAEKKEREAREKQVKKEKKASTPTVKTKKKKEEVEEEDENEAKEKPSGLGRPRSMSDPNLTTSIDDNGLLSVDRPDGWVGAYSPESRKVRIERFMEKRNHRVWTKKVKYGVRKNFADSRLRVKGRFVKKEDELLMRDLMSLT